jgi:CRISPR-associated protein Csy1
MNVYPMLTTPNKRQTELHLLISDFLTERLKSKLEKLGLDDPKNDELRQQFIPATWLEDAARRAAQIQAATHTLKPVHPDAKGSNLYCPPSTLTPLDVVGSHCLGDDFADDVVGNAAALDVYKFLKQKYEGQSLLALAMTGDADLAAAISDDPAKAQEWMQAFAALAQPRGRVASHTLAKQLYWPTGDDVHHDDSYQLLSPLYASSLAHKVFERLQDDRFSETAQAAREARKLNGFSERAVHEYPQLAVQQLGGTKPQNVSQLNSERRGNNSLLASLPPVWRSQDVKPLHNTESMFASYSHRPAVREAIRTLLAFLKSDPNPNQETRDKRAAWVDTLIDEFLQFTAELLTLEPGWSQDSTCQLSSAECRWLDPEGVAAQDAALSRSPPTDTDERISAAFANWLNGQLRGALPVGDTEFMVWRKAMTEHIKAAEREDSYAD